MDSKNIYILSVMQQSSDKMSDVKINLKDSRGKKIKNGSKVRNQDWVDMEIDAKSQGNGICRFITKENEKPVLQCKVPRKWKLDMTYDQVEK